MTRGRSFFRPPQVVEAVDRARRFEEEGRQAKHRLKEAEKELEATRRKMQEDAEKLVRMKRKDVRLAAEIEKIQVTLPETLLESERSCSTPVERPLTTYHS